MPHYIKITGRGYLKELNHKYPYIRQTKFSKQLSLAYSFNSKEEAQAYITEHCDAMKPELDVWELTYKTGKKIVSFPEMFSSKEKVRVFINKEGVYQKFDTPYKNSYSLGPWGMLTYYFRNDGHYEKLNVKESIHRFENEWYGIKEIKSSLNNIKSAYKLIKNAKVVEENNFEVTVTKANLKNHFWEHSMADANSNPTIKYKRKIYCSSCGASIPGGKYLIHKYGQFCPYCLLKFAEEAKKNVDSLGEPMRKAYMSALFVKNL